MNYLQLKISASLVKLRRVRAHASIGVFGGVALFGAVAAYAHAQVVHADPPAGSMLTAAPGQVTLKFSEKLEPVFSSIVVRNAMGARVDKNDGYIDKGNALMRISLQPLTPGNYIVEWRALSVSTYKTEGAFIFTIVEPK